MEKPSKSFWQVWNMSFGFFGIQFGWGLQMANMSAIYATYHRSCQRPYMGSPRTPSALLPRRCAPEFNRSDPDATLVRAVDRCGAPLDSGRIDQHQHGTVSGLCRRSASGIAKNARLRHAEPVYWTGCSHCFGTALDADQLVPSTR